MNQRQPCVVEDGQFACSRCRNLLRPGVARVCPGPRPGLGDYVASGLSSIGLTKEQFEAIVGGPCNCDERHAILNRLGARWLGMSPGSTSAENSGVDARTGAARLGE